MLFVGTGGGERDEQVESGGMEGVRLDTIPAAASLVSTPGGFLGGFSSAWLKWTAALRRPAFSTQRSLLFPIVGIVCSVEPPGPPCGAVSHASQSFLEGKLGEQVV